MVQQMQNPGGRRWLEAAAMALWMLVPVACQQKMAEQPSYKPLAPSSFFADGRSARPLVAGTVARGHLRTDIHLFEGKVRRQETPLARPAALLGAGGNPLGAAVMAGAGNSEYQDYVMTFPYPITRQILERGYHRYMIYCVVCHDPLGTGHGEIVERGYTPPPSFHIPRLREAPVGHLFAVITNGYGSMPDYREQVPVHDRWAIVAYIRALQLSQHFPEKELTEEMRREWQGTGQAQAAGGAAP
jgi:hypothetical protein